MAYKKKAVAMVEKSGTLQDRIIAHILDDTDKRSVAEFCRDEGVSPTVYVKYKGDPVFQSRLSACADDLLKGSILEVTKSFVSEAIKGSATQQRMYFEMLDRYTQKIEINNLNDSIKSMSTSDLMKLASDDE